MKINKRVVTKLNPVKKARNRMRTKLVGTHEVSDYLDYWNYVLHDMPHNLQRFYLLAGWTEVRNLAGRIGRKETYLRSMNSSCSKRPPLDVALLMADNSGGLITIQGLSQPGHAPFIADVDNG